MLKVKKWEKVKRRGLREAEEWRISKDTILDISREVCGIMKICNKENMKCSEWWSE